MRTWRPLVVLALAQFLMVLDQAVMNVSISQLVDDFDTSVTTIQAVITLYALVMATTMITGGRIGDIVGRRRAYVLGLTIYGAGSALTAASWNIPALVTGWSLLEGIGAALVLPALVALLAANYEGSARVVAFGVIGGVAGIGIAAGPIVGGYFTSNLSWRWVFVGEVGLAIVGVLASRWIADAPVEGRRPKLDTVGAVLSAAGLGMVVIAMLQASSWGWLLPKQSPVVIFGLALTPFMALGGLVVIGLFVRWQEKRTSTGEDPLVRLELLHLPTLRSGLLCFLSQNVILLGIFFTLPLYLQIVLGFDALETGVRMLPISVAMFATSVLGPVLTPRFGPKRVVQVGFVLLVVAAFAMLGTIDFELQRAPFVVSLTILGIGMGMIASQLGNVVQSAVTTDQRSEAGGLQYTSAQLGSAIGTALIGAIVVSVLVNAFLTRIDADERVSPDVVAAIEVRMGAGASFVPADAARSALLAAGVAADETEGIVENYEDAQLESLRIGLFAAGALALLSLFSTRHLPLRGSPDSGSGATRSRSK